MARGPVVAVDLGQHSIKMLALKRTRKGTVVVDAVSQPIGLPPKASAEEIAQRSVEVIKALRKALSRGGKRAAVALSGRTAFSRYVKVPAVSGRQLDRIIQYEARQQIPFPMEQVNFDRYFMPSRPGTRELEVMLLAVRRDIASELVSRLKAGGIRTDIVDIGPISLFNAYMATQGPAKGEVTAVISIGASSTDIVVEQDGQLRFMRSAPNAGNGLTELLARRLDVSWEEAERLKTLPAAEYDKAKEGPTAEEVATVLEDGFDAIVGDIRRSLDFYVSQPEAAPVTRVIVCGGTARMEGTTEFLEDRLGVPVTLADFTQSETLSWEVSNGSDYALEGTLVGLAVRWGGKAAMAVNLAPDSTKQRLELERRAPMLALCGLLVTGLLFAGFTGVRTCIDADRQALERIQNVVNPSGIGPGQQELKQVRQIQQEFDSRFEKLALVAEKRGRVTKRYLEVLSMVPEDVWLTTVSLGSDRMTVQGKALNEQRLQEFISNLRLSPYTVDDKVVLSNYLTAPDGSIGYTIEAQDFTNPTRQALDFVANLKKAPDLPLIMAVLTQNPGGPSVPPSVTDESPKGPATAVVGTYEVDEPAARVGVLRKVYMALQKSQVADCDRIQLRFFDREFNERNRYEISFSETADFYAGKRTEEEILAALQAGRQEPPPTPEPSPTPMPEGMGMYGYGYGYGYGYPGGYGMIPMGGM